MVKYTILFEGAASQDGDVLIKPLNHGSQGEVYLVSSMTSNLYVHKIFKKGQKHHEANAYKYLPTNIAPELVGNRQDYTSDTLTFEYCNGGDLCMWMLNFTNENKKLSEIFTWYFLSEMLKKLTVLHHSAEITHCDFHTGNILLHWPDEQAQLPKILIGDWGMASCHKDPQVKKKRPTNDDLYRLHKCLEEFEEISVSNMAAKFEPLEQYIQVRKQASAEKRKTPNLRETKFIADKLIPLATKKITELTESGDEVGDLQWTKPKVSKQPTLVEKADARTLRQWERMYNDNQTLSGAWKWVPETAIKIRRMSEDVAANLMNTLKKASASRKKKQKKRDSVVTLDDLLGGDFE